MSCPSRELPPVCSYLDKAMDISFTPRRYILYSNCKEFLDKRMAAICPGLLNCFPSSWDNQIINSPDLRPPPR